jgi:hypothetical protein
MTVHPRHRWLRLIDPQIVAARIDTLVVAPRVMQRLKRWIGMYTSTG